MRKYDLRRTISFHSRVVRAREFAAEMPDIIEWMPAGQRPEGTLWSSYAWGGMSAGQRHVLLQHLSRLDDGQRGLLTNARCLSEGVDVPALDGVAFIDPRRSEVDIVQAVGRAIRKSENKIVGTIVIPVYIDTEQDPEVALDDSAFKPVWDVIKALRSHDENLGEQLDECRRQLGRQGRKPRLPKKIHLDLPEAVDSNFARAFNVRLVNQTTASWEFWFGLLDQFVERHGHANVGQPYRVDGYRLGMWVSHQRRYYANGTVDADRQRRLEELPGWTWDRYADQWDEGSRRLVEYVESHGDARVPRFYTTDGYKLGYWINNQRDSYAKGTLAADRQRRLQGLPGWTWARFTDQWEEGYRRLVEYVESQGDSRVPQGFTVDGYRLGNWVNTQRGYKATGKLDAERQRRLHGLPGWSWISLADRWEDNFQRLVGYVEKHGHARVPRHHTVESHRLGVWVSHRREDYARGILDADRQRRLEELPGWTWDPLTAQWEEGFGQLVKYVESHGDARVGRFDTIEGYKLGHWVSSQRDGYRKGKLDANRQRRLEGLPGWTWKPPRGPKRRSSGPLGTHGDL